MYHVGANAILIEPFQKKDETHQIAAHNRILERIKKADLQVDLQVMDNEASKAFLANITNKWKYKHQLVPPDMH